MKKFLIAVVAVTLVAAFAIPSMAVDLGGQLMWRAEYDKNRDFEDDAQNGRGADMLQRTQLHATANPTDSTTIKITIQGSGAWGDAGSQALELHEAYVQEDNIFGSDLSLRLGRQVLSFDDQRIIGALNWSKTPNKDDAIKISYGSDDFDVQAFAAKKFESFNSNLGGADADIYGVHATIKTIPNNSLSAYAFAQIGNKFGTNGKLKRYTIGARLKGKVDAVDYTVELPFQTGQIDDTEDISAYAFAIRGGYTMPGPNKVRIGGEYTLATGDNDGADGEESQFSVIQPTGHAHLGSMDYNGWSNLQAYSVNVSAMATPDLKIVGAYWKFDTVDVESVCSNTVGSGGALTCSDDKGSEVDVTAIYKYNKKLTLKGGYSFYLPGDAQNDNRAGSTGTADNNAHWGWLMAIANF